ncbi:hypothetical protein [Chondrinema litorale]|uniref:hypothetical protein n=1 Tax=Chondrinema litorale TaxID=2994555 RepID=UPI0025428F01|nr:hypothetical protein [Chondrinema litorale]UZR99732.1 hypothetical protein OQ292_38220 [Chondrinema litorale]
MNMLQQLIKATNNEEFYKNYRLELNEFNAQIDSPFENEVRLRLSISHEYDKNDSEKWEISAKNVADYYLPINSLTLPFVHLELLEDHPA